MTVKPKTRFGAMMRSMFFPGLGQFYSERKLWGWGWIVSELAVGGAIYMFGTEYQTAYDDYNSYIGLYQNETDVDLIREYKDQAQISHEKHGRSCYADRDTHLCSGRDLWRQCVARADYRSQEEERS